MRKHIPILLVIFIIFLSSTALARPQFSTQTGQQCNACHIQGSFALTPTGEAFRDNGFNWPVQGETPAPGRPNPIITLLRFLHIIAAFSWIGAIIFIHVILTPKAVRHGIPVPAFRLAWTSIATLIVTGFLLIYLRFGSLAVLSQPGFGRLLAIKIALFFILVLSAALVTLRLNRLLLTAGQLPEPLSLDTKEELKTFTAEELRPYDGKDGRPAYVSYGGYVYDVTSSRLWREGRHAARHIAGQDLTSDLKGAPHGPDVFDRVKLVGKLADTASANTEGAPAKLCRRATGVFHFLAYFNLFVAIAILFILALWRT